MYFCRIDVAKRKHVVLVLDEQGQIVKPSFTIHNTRAGFGQLHRVLSHASEKMDCVGCDTHVGQELQWLQVLS